MSDGLQIFCVFLGIFIVVGLIVYLIRIDFFDGIEDAGSFKKYREVRKAEARLQRLYADLTIDKVNAKCGDVQKEIDEKRLKAYEEAIKSYEAATKGDA